MTKISSSTIFLVLTVAFLGVCQAGKYVEIPPHKYSQDSLIPVLRTYGINFVLVEAFQDGRIQDTQYELYSTNHIYVKKVGLYYYYKYDVSLKNSKGDRIYAEFEISYHTQSKKKNIESYDYDVVKAGYDLIPENQYHSNLLWSLGVFGKDSLVKRAAAEGRLEGGDYELVRILSISRKLIGKVSYYQYEIECRSSDGSYELDGYFEVEYTPSPVRRILVDYDYDIVDLRN